jgi:hypothetical protein
MPRTTVVDRPDFHAWRAYRAVVDAEAGTEQVAVFDRPGRPRPPQRVAPRWSDHRRPHRRCPLHDDRVQRPRIRDYSVPAHLCLGRRRRRGELNDEPVTALHQAAAAGTTLTLVPSKAVSRVPEPAGVRPRQAS